MKTCMACGQPYDSRNKMYCSNVCALPASKNKRHGMADKTVEYKAWTAMRERCNNPRCDKYHLYGGRGIKVAERWNSFENFYADMGPRPSKTHSIERRDNSGNYETSNCYWATKAEQSRNRRPYSEWNTKRRRALSAPQEQQP